MIPKFEQKNRTPRINVRDKKDSIYGKDKISEENRIVMSAFDEYLNSQF